MGNFLRIKDAIDLHNARIEDTKSTPKMTRQRLGEIIYPKSSYQCISMSMSNLLSGAKKKLNPEWIVKICAACDVDANFLYGVGYSPYEDEFDSFFKK